MCVKGAPARVRCMSNATTGWGMRVRAPVRLTREAFERLSADEAERLISSFRCFSEQGLGCKEALRARCALTRSLRRVIALQPASGGSRRAVRGAPDEGETAA